MPILNADYSDLSFDDMARSIGLKLKHMPILIGSFLEESETIVESINSAIYTNDYLGIKSNAHSIKGSSANLKFTEIYEMSKEMEHAAADSNADFDYRGYLEAMKSAIATIKS